jgi:hypothetical protein
MQSHRTAHLPVEIWNRLHFYFGLCDLTGWYSIDGIIIERQKTRDICSAPIRIISNQRETYIKKWIAIKPIELYNYIGMYDTIQQTFSILMAISHRQFCQDNAPGETSPSLQNTWYRYVCLYMYEYMHMQRILALDTCLYCIFIQYNTRICIHFYRY